LPKAGAAHQARPIGTAMNRLYPAHEDIDLDAVAAGGFVDRVHRLMGVAD
jgi:hypothetical protein